MARCRSRCTLNFGNVARVPAGTRVLTQVHRLSRQVRVVRAQSGAAGSGWGLGWGRWPGCWAPRDGMRDHDCYCTIGPCGRDGLDRLASASAFNGSKLRRRKKRERREVPTIRSNLICDRTRAVLPTQVSKFILKISQRFPAVIIFILIGEIKKEPLIFPISKLQRLILSVKYLDLFAYF